MKGKHFIVPILTIILVIGIQQAYADSHPHWLPDAQYKWKSAWCDGFKGVNGTNGVMDCYGHYQKMLKFNLKENFAIQTEDPPSAKELKDELTKKINELRIVPKAPEPTEAEKLGISEKTLKQLKEKTLAQHPTDALETLKKCKGGEEQASGIQAKYSIPDIQNLEEKIGVLNELYPSLRLVQLAELEDLTIKEKQMVYNCLSTLYVRALSNQIYPGKVMDEDTTPKTEAGHGNVIALEKTKAVKPDADRFATPEKMKESEDAANAYIDSQSYLKHLRDKNWDNIDQVKATKTVDEQKKRSDVKTFEHQVLEALEKGQQKMCQIAWENSAAKGELSKRNWRIMLLDGTCDEYIKNLVEKRGDYKLKEFRGQNADNCKDCKQFK